MVSIRVICGIFGGGMAYIWANRAVCVAWSAFWHSLMKACLGLFGVGVSAVCFLQYGVLRGEGECDDPGRKEGEREGKQYGLKVGGQGW